MKLTTVIGLFLIALISATPLMAQKSYLDDADHALYKEEKYHEAIEMYKKAYVKEPGRDVKAEIIFKIAESYRLSDQPEQAEVWYEKSIIAQYADPIARLHLAEMKMETGKYDEALVAFQKYAAEKPSDPRGKIGIESAEKAQKWADNPVTYVVNPVVLINSEFYDFSPAITGRKGDEMVYQIMNDDRIHNESGGEKIGAEIHIIVYQDQATNFVDSTTFIEVTIINKGQNSFSDFKVAFYIDPDVGFSDDDYIGSDPSKNLMYAYNGSNHDPGQGGSPGYGSFPPTLGVVSLTKDVDYSGTFHRYDGGVLYAMTDPSSPADYWNYMNGKWLDGSDWTLGGDGHGGASGSTHHLYNGNPSQGTGWTELDIDGNGTSNVSGDRRLLMTSIEESFQPGDTLTYNYGIIVNRNGDLMENIQGIINYADSVKTYFHNTTYACIHQGTGTADVFVEEDINYPFNFEITRLDGEGNMSRAVKIDAQSEQNILDSISVKSIGYKRGHGPIEVRRTDTINQTLGHFVLKFNDYATNIDTANWTIYHYDTIGGVLIDSVNSTSAINIGNEMLIPQWGMAVKVKQHNYFCKDNSPQCTFRDKIAKPLETTLTFEDDNNNWLTGVKNANGMAPMNWIMSGDFSGTSIPGDSIHNPACYSANFYDYNNLFTNMADGIVSPSILARYGECDLTPIALSSSVGTYSLLMSNVVMDLPTVYQTSIDIVFTSDKSKWTRSPVIELNKNDLTSLNGGKAGFLRQSPSVNKQGNADGTGTRMGWFPGYAIDVESGRRLNIAFGENSTMTADNGADMLWNPSDRLMDSNGNYVLGGQHVIYVYGRDLKGMPNYDEGAFIHQQLTAENIAGYKNVFSNLSWVVQPLLSPGKQLNSSDARLEIRINKEFKTRVLSNRNEGRPMFSWDVKQYEGTTSLTNFDVENGQINIYPNPATSQVKVVWNEINVEEITITSFQGRLVKRVAANGSKGEKTIAIDELSPGVYFVNVGSVIRKLIVQ